jgi:HSP20 family protein
MSNLIRYKSSRDMMTLRDAMDQLFDEAFTRPFGMMEMSLPAIDLYQTNEDVVVKAALPGMAAEEVEISVTGDALTIKGEIRQKEEREDASYLIREQRYGRFERSLMLPTEVQSDKAQAEFENGILTVTLPKAEQVRPKTITVKVK